VSEPYSRSNGAPSSRRCVQTVVETTVERRACKGAVAAAYLADVARAGLGREPHCGKALRDGAPPVHRCRVGEALLEHLVALVLQVAPEALPGKVGQERHHGSARRRRHIPETATGLRRTEGRRPPEEARVTAAEALADAVL
jgi:hypothetical protein